MFYVGVYCVYEGANKAGQSLVKVLDKLGPHPGRAERFLVEHPPTEKDGNKYRAMVLVLPPSFRLRNDVIASAVKAYRCDWQTAKFHCYRLAAVNVLGKQDVWSDVLAEAEAVAKTE